MALKDVKIIDLPRIFGPKGNFSFNVFLENDIIVGDNVTIKSGVQLWDGLRVENNVFIGRNVTFTNHLSLRSKEYSLNFEKTFLKLCCTIWANSTIIAGIPTGEFSFIGAGGVVTKNIPPCSA